MVGGLIVSQVLTLFTTPVIYLAFDRLARRVAARAARTPQRLRRRKRHEPLGALHRPPGRDDAADHRRRARRRRSRSACCRCRRCRRSTSRRSRCQASLPGASPETMAATVATPLERSLGRIAGVTEMTSTSSLGSTRITLQFDLNRDIDGAARDVQAAINAARELPAAGAAQQSDLPQGQSGRRADHDPGAHVGHDDAGPDVRRGVDDPRAEAVAGRRASAR